MVLLIHLYWQQDLKWTDEFVCPYNALLIKIKVEFIHIFTRLKYPKLYTMYHLELLFSVYSNITVYLKYIGTSIKVGCATRSLYASSGPKAEGVPTNNQRGRGSGPCRLWGGLDNARHIVPTTLSVRVQRFRNDLHKTVKEPSTRPIVLSMIAGSYWRCRRRLTIFEPDEMKFDSSSTLLSL